MLTDAWEVIQKWNCPGYHCDISALGGCHQRRCIYNARMIGRDHYGASVWNVACALHFDCRN